MVNSRICFFRALTFVWVAAIWICIALLFREFIKNARMTAIISLLKSREISFILYWGLGSLQSQRDFILSCIKECEIGRKRAESDRRKISYNYYLPKGTESVKICQQFLLKTLDISQMTLRYTKSHKIASFMSKSDQQRGKNTPLNKYSQSQTQNVINFIKKSCLPFNHTIAETKVTNVTY